MKDIVQFEEIENKIGYKFRTRKYLKTAFIHSSYANEHKIESNEKLEFLGDAVIEFIVTEILYLQFKGKEGDMSKIRSMIVSEKPLSDAVEKLQLEKYLLKGVGESKNEIESKAVKCDLFEALCGAIYLDGGIDSTRKFFELAVGDIILNLKINGYVDDPKTKLQELLKQAKIEYKTVKTGIEHQPIYKSHIFINNVEMGFGEGSNKKTAEENAASVALNNLKKV